MHLAALSLRIEVEKIVPKSFSLEEKACLLDFMAASDHRFEYITAMRAFGEVGHNCYSDRRVCVFAFTADAVDNKRLAE